MTLVLITVVLAQVHAIDLRQEPWATVAAELRAEDPTAARARLESLGREGPGEPWERAHAWAWAGQIAVQRRDLDAARRDFEAARRTDPGCFDGRMASVHLGEVALWQHRYADAERALAPVEHDPDPIVATYAAARLRGVRERPRRLGLRYGAIAWLAVGALALALRTAAAVGAQGWRRTMRSLGRALLVTEAAAVTGGVLVPRWITELAASGWMAFALPAGFAIALVWATRPVPGAPGAPGAHRTRPRWRTAVTVMALLVALAAGLYLALDITWWSVDDPVA